MNWSITRTATLFTDKQPSPSPKIFAWNPSKPICQYQTTLSLLLNFLSIEKQLGPSTKIFAWNPSKLMYPKTICYLYRRFVSLQTDRRYLRVYKAIETILLNPHFKTFFICYLKIKANFVLSRLLKLIKPTPLPPKKNLLK